MGHREQKSWWERNWAWSLGCGCLTLILVPVGCIGLSLWGAKSWVESTDFYDQALERARNNPEVVDVLGEPIEPKWTGVRGQLVMNDDGGHVDATFRLTGPDGAGDLHVVADKVAEGWELDELELELDDGATIDLLAEEANEALPDAP